MVREPLQPPLFNQCRKCQIFYPNNEDFFAFYVVKGVKRRRRVCRECHGNQVRQCHAKNPESVKRANKKRYEEKYEEVMQSIRAYRARKLSATHIPYTEQEVLEQWGTNCHICGGEIDFSAGRSVGISENWQMSLHLDHVTPLIAGGDDTINNVKPAHALCNLKKPKKVKTV